MDASGSAIGSVDGCTCKAGTGFIRYMHVMECVPAPIGTFGEGGGREEWQLCPRNLTSPAGSSSIKQCVAAAVVCSGPAAMAPPSAESLADCVCVPGFAPAGGSPTAGCTICPEGTYSRGGSIGARCLSCRQGFTSHTGAIDSADCFPEDLKPEG
eukprot:gene11352-11501_t